jgi:hypothetical protein
MKMGMGKTGCTIRRRITTKGFDVEDPGFQAPAADGSGFKFQ